MQKKISELKRLKALNERYYKALHAILDLKYESGKSRPYVEGMLNLAKNALDPYRLTYDEAMELLAMHDAGNGVKVHSFIGCTAAMMGADMEIQSVRKQLLETSDIRLGGANMKSMGHAVCFKTEKNGYVFLETLTEKVDAIYEARGVEEY